jgi:hypothetical protein
MQVPRYGLQQGAITPSKEELSPLQVAPGSVHGRTVTGSIPPWPYPRAEAYNSGHASAP